MLSYTISPAGPCEPWVPDAVAEHLVDFLDGNGAGGRWAYLAGLADWGSRDAAALQDWREYLDDGGVVGRLPKSAALGKILELRRMTLTPRAGHGAANRRLAVGGPDLPDPMPIGVRRASPNH